MKNKTNRGMRYDENFKQEAVRLVRDEHMTISQVSRDLGVSQVSLSRWIKLAEDRGKPSVISSVHEENRRLKRELELITMERDILKKAVGIFSQHPK